ncbi:Kinesin-related protein 1 [Candida viswanathii]|uniref:Kinesin-related protein 1 n=1 Tax=Candida viswanathii TaxID=5486 RepID=A0A367Y606_9ASCO|nr:Kinesin-related protein 1 [Candida viswanathii]
MSTKSNNIKVSVRVRPLLKREVMPENENPQSLITMPVSEPHKVVLTNPKGKTSGDDKSYLFDECIWSFSKGDSHYTDNCKYYERTGPQLLSHFFEGYNVCLLAYGQTSSGKTFTMMGDSEQPGIIPLLIKDILKQMEICINQKINCELKLLYVEIYNEQVKDLLEKGTVTKKCKVREHPSTGPYVENVKEYTVEDYEHFLKLLTFGNSNRSTASTSMNDKSSRSHAILTLTLKQTKFENSSPGDIDEVSSIGEASEEMISNIKLVDLAGSERLQKTKVYGQQDRLKEGTLINKSLTVLGRCINTLASNPTALIPYRESILTYLLKENLAGNSKTCMIFCVSPLDYEESHQTLNYANEVKKIKTLAKANKTKLSTVPINWQQLQQTDQTVIDSLKGEIEALTNKLKHMEKVSLVENQKPIDNIIEFLEKESNKVKFENKYLKQMMSMKNSHIKELNNHIDFITNEYQLLFSEYKQLQHASLEKQKTRLLRSFEQTRSEMDLELQIFDPENLDCIA